MVEPAFIDKVLIFKKLHEQIIDGLKSSHLALVECLLWSSEIIGFLKSKNLALISSLMILMFKFVSFLEFTLLSESSVIQGSMWSKFHFIFMVVWDHRVFEIQEFSSNFISYELDVQIVSFYNSRCCLSLLWFKGLYDPIIVMVVRDHRIFEIQELCSN